MAQHQVFGFGVYRGALPAGDDSGGTDLDATIGKADVHEASAADEFASGLFARSEYGRLTAILFCEGGGYPLFVKGPQQKISSASGPAACKSSGACPARSG